ncbi:hypothetical protein NX059_006265 [Plenodomus lindquistii]|nr:hypothetical protein NX059_006265 [Plenodomus lindquistii]
MAPTAPLTIEPHRTIFVTGVNGLVGSHVVDQLLKRGYNVRGAVRDVKKNAWLKEYFDEKYTDVKFDLVEVKDMTVEGCYDEVVNDIDGFIHVASPIVNVTGAESGIAIGVTGALNALKACAKMPSVKRFVFTSSSIAATFAKPDVEFSIDTNSYNEAAIEAVTKDPTMQNGLHIYAALKTATEKAAWKWVEENNPSFVFNTVLPNANFGSVLVPKHQGYPSTIHFARAAWTGEQIKEVAAYIDPQWFISPTDTALLHVAALLHSEIKNERLFGFAEPWSFNKMLDTFRKLYPERKFAANLDGLGEDRMSVPNERAEEVLRWVKGSGWDSWETSLADMSRDWVNE